ncbi:MAG: FlgO family outer membrane protein [Anaeromyxobacteraceae bacterium]
MHPHARYAAALALVLAVVPARAEDLAAASRRAADALATVLAAAPERATVKAIAVPPLGVQGGVGADQGVRAAEALGARLATVARVSVLDAQTLKGVLGEARLSALNGNLRADEPALTSRNLAQAIVTGTVAVEGDHLRLTARLVLVPSGKLLAQAQGQADAVVSAAVPVPPPPAPVGSSAASRATAEPQRIEVAMRRVADGLAAGFARLPGNARYHRLAVLPLGEVGDRVQKQRLGTVVAAELATDLRRDHGLLLVERERLGQVLGELKLQQMTSPDSSTTAKIGQLAEAQALVIGSVAEAGDRYLVTARIVATETGEALAAESASVPAAGLVALASDAVVLRTRGDAAFRSLLVPGLGQAYNRQKAKAWAFGGAALALAGGAAVFHLSGTSSRSDYDKATSSEVATKAYDDAQTSFRTRNWLLAGLGAVWAVNVIDAYASGVDGEAALGGGVAIAPVAAPGAGGLVVAGRF